MIVGWDPLPIQRHCIDNVKGFFTNGLEKEMTGPQTVSLTPLIWARMPISKQGGSK